MATESQATPLDKLTFLRRKHPRTLTKGEVTKKALDEIGFLVLLTIGSIVGMFIMRALRQNCLASILLFGALAFPLYILFDLAKIVWAAVAGKKVVICPFCGHQHDAVMRNIDWLLCQGCTELLLPGTQPHPSLIKVACPYCGRSIGVDENVDSLVCDDCNLSLLIVDGQAKGASEETTICSQCGATLNKTMLYCKECGQLTAQAAAVDVTSMLIEERLRKSPNGSLMLGKIVLRNLQEAAEATSIDFDGLSTIGKMLRQIVVVVESWEEAVRDEANHIEVADRMPQLDYTYALLLQRLGAELLAMKKKGIEHPWEFSWVDVRKAILDRLQASEQVKDRVVLREWRKELIQWSTGAKEGFLGTSTTYYWIENDDQVRGLFEESELLSPEAVAKAQELGWPTVSGKRDLGLHWLGLGGS